MSGGLWVLLYCGYVGSVALGAALGRWTVPERCAVAALGPLAFLALLLVGGAQLARRGLRCRRRHRRRRPAPARVFDASRAWEAQRWG